MTVDEFAALLIRLIDPRTDDDELAGLVSGMAEDDLKDALTIVVAAHSACVDGAASHLRLGVDEYLRRLHLKFRDNLREAESITHEGGMFI